MKEDIRKNTEEGLRMEDFPDEPQEEEMINETEGLSLVKQLWLKKELCSITVLL